MKKTIIAEEKMDIRNRSGTETSGYRKDWS
jgi:hypothetical protein